MADAPDENIIRRDLETDEREPASAISEVIAEIEGEDPTDLPAIWACTDGMLANMFSDPPKPAAQMQIEFSYQDYRITVHQDGTAEFLKLE
jgi:hypothetical protein